MALLVAALAAGVPSAAARSVSVVSPQTPGVASGMIGVGGVALAPQSPTARAGDCCTGWVYVSVNAGTTLSRRVPVRIYGDDPDHHYDATVTPHLSVGRRQLARLPGFTVRDVSPTTARRRVLRIPRATVELAARYGRRTGHHRAVLTFVFKQLVDRSTGTPMPNYASDSYLRRRPPITPPPQVGVSRHSRSPIRAASCTSPAPSTSRSRCRQDIGNSRAGATAA